MAWIELHDDLMTHKKTYALMNALHIKRWDSIGILCMFWCWALKSASNGEITDFPARAIADATDWKRKPQALLDALVSSGWIDKSADGRLLIHDWDDYTWRYFDKVEQAKEQTAKRVREYRKRKTLLQGNASTVTNVTHRRNAVTQCNAPTVPNLTVPNQDDGKPSSSARDEKPSPAIPEMTEEMANSLSGMGMLYEQTAGRPVPGALAGELRFRLLDGGDPELLKEAMRASIGKNNEAAYFTRVVQSWTAQGIKTYKQLMDTLLKTAPMVKGHKHSPEGDGPPSFDVGAYVADSLSRFEREAKS